MQKPLGVLFLTFAMAGAGCGVKKETHQRCLDQVAQLQGELNSTQADREQKAAQIAQLEQSLSSTQRAKTQTEREKEQRILALMSEMQAGEDELLELRAQRDKAEARLASYRKLNDRLRALVDTGKLKVSFRNGQMVLELPSEVLFGSGEADLSGDGKTALAEVLDVLKEFKDRHFLVAGHTDNVPLRSRRYKNNWYLSSARAVNVVEFMIQAGWDPNNLAAAGYGEFDPIAPNDTAANKQRNRRIEIILVPDLSELPNLTVEPKEDKNS